MTHLSPAWRRAVVALAAILVGVSGCVATPTVSPPSPSGSATPRDFTVGTTERVTALDPVAVTDSMSTSVTLALFQRLMTMDEGKVGLRPDAAEDCKYTSEVQVECTLRTGLTFDNGHALTASDVKFSITRALRLGVDGSSARQLAALSTIDTLDDHTVRFNLSWADNQFITALSEPAASIVDEDVYDPDTIRGLADNPVGSGPFWLSASFTDRLYLRQFRSYKGYNGASSEFVSLRFFTDSAAIEEAMKQKEVDVVWRSLNAAALKRLDGQIAGSKDKVTDSGFRRESTVGQRVHFLRWSDTSPYRLDSTLRTTISVALQDQRTLDSILPVGIEGHIRAFPLGGMTTLPSLIGDRPRLTLSYDAQITGDKEMARDLRDRIESAAGVSVQLVADTPTADLVLYNYKAWNATPIAWLQPYRTKALPGSDAKIAEYEKLYRTTTDTTQREIYLSEMQKQAAVDATVLPISQDDDDMFLASTVKVHEPKYGPGWQLALWSVGLQ
jgi:peptide/nickel transport system substrate-binding protein